MKNSITLFLCTVLLAIVGCDYPSKGKAFPNAAPVVTIKQSGYAIRDVAVTLTADATDADGKVVTGAWNLGDGTTGTGFTVTHTYTAVGTYTVAWTVTDDRGASTSTSILLTVTLTAPTGPLAVIQYPIKEYTVGENVFLDGRGSLNVAAGNGNYQWTINGAILTPNEPTKNYTLSSAGQVVVKLKVWDKNGLSHETTVTINVTVAPSATPSETLKLVINAPYATQGVRFSLIYDFQVFKDGVDVTRQVRMRTLDSRQMGVSEPNADLFIYNGPRAYLQAELNGEVSNIKGVNVRPSTNAGSLNVAINRLYMDVGETITNNIHVYDTSNQEITPYCVFRFVKPSDRSFYPIGTPNGVMEITNGDTKGLAQGWIEIQVLYNGEVCSAPILFRVGTPAVTEWKFAQAQYYASTGTVYRPTVEMKVPVTYGFAADRILCGYGVFEIASGDLSLAQGHTDGTVTTNAQGEVMVGLEYDGKWRGQTLRIVSAKGANKTGYVKYDNVLVVDRTLAFWVPNGTTTGDPMFKLTAVNNSPVTYSDQEMSEYPTAFAAVIKGDVIGKSIDIRLYQGGNWGPTQTPEFTTFFGNEFIVPGSIRVR